MESLRKSILAAPAAALARLGRQGTRAIAALVFIGIAVPPLDALLKPFVTEAIFVLLCIAFLRMDPAALRGYLGRPAVVLAATAWTMLAIPVSFGLSCLALGLEARSPDLLLALMLQAVASPMMAAPAFAALMDLDATLVLVTLVTSTALTPFTAPSFAYAFLGPALTLSPLALGIKLFAILAGSAFVGVILRRIAGSAAIKRHKDEIDGFNILVLFVFVAAVMENVAARFFAAPIAMIGLAALAFAVFFRRARLNHPALLQVWPGTRPGARAHGRATQYGTDACGDRRGPARPSLALFRPMPVPNLPVSPNAQTAGAAIGRPPTTSRPAGKTR
jgi:hypothetical protein